MRILTIGRSHFRDWNESTTAFRCHDATGRVLQCSRDQYLRRFALPLQPSHLPIIFGSRRSAIQGRSAVIHQNSRGESDRRRRITLTLGLRSCVVLFLLWHSSARRTCSSIIIDLFRDVKRQLPTYQIPSKFFRLRRKSQKQNLSFLSSVSELNMYFATE